MNIENLFYDIDSSEISDAFINTLAFKDLLKLLIKLFHIADFLCIESLIIKIMTIISKLTLEFTPQGIYRIVIIINLYYHNVLEASIQLCAVEYENLSVEDKQILNKICLG